MKIKLLLFACLLIIGKLSIAQKSVKFSQGQRVSYQACGVPQVVHVYYNVQAEGYTEADSIFNINIDYGDGTPMKTFRYKGVFLGNGEFYFFADIEHNYSTSGKYIVKSSVSAVDGNRDTVSSEFFITNDCDTLRGKVYADRNGNCIKDAKDVSISVRGFIEIQQNGKFYDYLTPDYYDGSYKIVLPKGYTYKVLTRPYGPHRYKLFCPANGEHIVNTLPSSGNDFALERTFYIDSLPEPQLTCNIPFKARLGIFIPSVGYSGDSLQIHWDFGDGKDTTYSTGPIYGYEGVSDEYGAHYDLFHTYTSKGNYSVRVILTSAEGKADTVFRSNEIDLRDTCGTISGYIYKDKNANCQFDTDEIPVENVPVHIEQNGKFVDYYYTDNKGKYSFTLPFGSTYDVLFPYYQYYGFSSICPASGKYTINSLPSANNNFGLVDTSITGVHEIAQANKISLYPNPANTHLMVSFNQTQASADIVLLDIVGNQILTCKIYNGQAELNTSLIENGTYILLVKDGNSVKREKIMIMH